MVSQNNVILTGIPRSGTSLCCALLSEIENVVALIEPLDMNSFMAQQNEEERQKYLTSYFQFIRAQIRDSGSVPAKQLQGEETNTFEASSGGGRKSAILEVIEKKLEKSMDDDCKIVVKHPNAFTALLDDLSSQFNCFAIIRNPLSVLASWNSLDHPLSRGHAPMAENFDSILKADLAHIDNDIDRQLTLLDWYYRKYRNCLSRDDIIRYEDIVLSNGHALKVIDKGAARLSRRLTSRNDSDLYDSDIISMLSEKLNAFPDHSGWTFYDRGEVEALRLDFAKD